MRHRLRKKQFPKILNELLLVVFFMISKQKFEEISNWKFPSESCPLQPPRQNGSGGSSGTLRRIYCPGLNLNSGRSITLLRILYLHRGAFKSCALRNRGDSEDGAVQTETEIWMTNSGINIPDVKLIG